MVSNLQNAIMLAKVGIAIFPSSGKVPLVPRYNKLDSEITAEERAAAIAEYREKHDGKRPVHVGCTTDVDVVKRMFRKHPTAVPSISCGPSGLVVFDCDTKHDGPRLFEEFCDVNGGLPEGAFSVTSQSGGKHHYLLNDGAFTNRAGTLKRDCGTDVRGIGGQTVAPGSVREDGKTYGTHADLIALLRAYTNRTLPSVPGFIRTAIGEASEGETPLNDRDPEVKSLLDQLGADEWPDFETTFDANIGKYCLECVRDRAPEFGELYDSPGEDRSQNRFTACRYLVAAFPGLTVTEYAAFCDEWGGSGEYDHRQLAREFAKAKRSPISIQSTGAAFGAVIDDDDGEATDRRPAKLPFEFESDVAASAVLPDWLIGEVIEAETLCVIYGAPNSGKSLAVLDMLYHVATGKPWRGRDVKRGSVLYISVEGPNGTARRAKAWREHHGVANGESLPLAFIRVDVDLFNDRKAAKAIVEAVALLESMTGLPCRAVAIDTVNAVTPGMDENSSADIGVFLRNLRTILAGTNAAVMPVHHTGKDESRGMRGSNALLAKAETTLLVSDGVLSTVKMRDGQRGQRFPFKIKILNLWADEKGKPVGAPVVIEPESGAALTAVEDDDEAVPLPSDKPEDKLRATLRALEECAAEQAEITGDAITESGVSKGQVFARLNRDRKAAGLTVFKDPTIATRLLDKLVKAGQAVRVGANRRTEYRII
jgi:hypothetical protein